jgi:hypothetical protein
VPALSAVIAFENLSGGMGTAAYAAYMASITDKRFTATQYALLTSLMGVPRVLASAPTGYLATHIGWEGFFIFCTVIAFPGLLLIYRLGGKNLMTRSQPPALPHNENAFDSLPSRANKILSGPSGKSDGRYPWAPPTGGIGSLLPRGRSPLSDPRYRVGRRNATDLPRFQQAVGIFLGFGDLAPGSVGLPIKPPNGSNCFSLQIPTGWQTGVSTKNLNSWNFISSEISNLRVRESDQTPSDMGKGFYSDDDTYYFRPVNFPADTPEKKKFLDRRNAMLIKLLKRLSHLGPSPLPGPSCRSGQPSSGGDRRRIVQVKERSSRGEGFSAV